MTLLEPIRLLLAIAGMGAACRQDPAPGRQAEGPRLVIESFAPASAYAIGMQPVTLVGTIRNVGREATPADAFIARISALAGLEYTEGDTRPRVPALEPNASTTFRWKLMPGTPDGPLVASLSLESLGKMPESRVAAIQHFSEAPPSDPAGFSKEAAARAGRSAATLENASIRVRVYASESGVPALIVSSRTQTGWRRVGVTMPIASVLSAEGGQRPWWEVFRSEAMRAATTKGQATLTLTGGFGLRWRGTVVLTLRTDSSVVDGKLLLAPLKSARISGMRFMPYFAGDGSFGAASAETLAPDEGAGTTAAVRWGVITTGTTWLEEATAGTWKATPLSNPEGADYRLLGAEWQVDGPPLMVTPSSMVEWRSRLFALTPSASVADARRVAPPPRPNAGAVTAR